MRRRRACMAGACVAGGISMAEGGMHSKGGG